RRCFPFIHETVLSHYEVAGAKRGLLLSTDDATYTYDTYGSVTNTTSTSTDLDSTTPASPFNGLQWTTTIVNAITNDASGNWCLGGPTTTTTTKTAPGQASVARKVDHVIDYANCRATQEIVEKNDTRLQVTTTFTFDPVACGNTTGDSVVGLDKDGNTMAA